MNKDELKTLKNALGEAYSLIMEEYETLQNEEWKQKYDIVIDKLQKAINVAKKYD